MRRCLAVDRPCPSAPSFPACSPLFLRTGRQKNHPSIARPCCPDQTSSYQIQPSSISARVRRVLFPARHLQRSVRSSPELEQATPYTTAHTKPLPKYISCDFLLGRNRFHLSYSQQIARHVICNYWRCYWSAK